MDMVTSYSGRSRCARRDAPRAARHVKAWENLQAGRFSNDPIRAASLRPYVRYSEQRIREPGHSGGIGLVNRLAAPRRIPQHEVTQLVQRQAEVLRAHHLRKPRPARPLPVAEPAHSAHQVVSPCSSDETGAPKLLQKSTRYKFICFEIRRPLSNRP